MTNSFDALTLDTQTFQQHAFQFERGLLGLLQQFRYNTLQVVISEIAAEETIAHLEKLTRDARDTLIKGIRNAGRFLAPLQGLPDGDFITKLDAASIARARFNAFVHNVGGLMIGVEHADMKDVLSRYFRTQPPFAQAKDKKHEFPDALALSSIEGWAKKHRKQVLAVSNHAGWKSYAENSDVIVVVSELSEALALLQQDPEHVHELVGAVLKNIQDNREGALATMFRARLTSALDRQSFNGEAESDFPGLDIEDVEVRLMNFDLHDWSETQEYTIVSIEEEVVVAEAFIDLDVVASANMTFSAYDTVDKDYIPMGDAHVSREMRLENVQALIVIEGNLLEGPCDVSQIELSDLQGALDFGYVEPDWRRDDDENPPD